jgi:hypothetical protein
VSGGSRNTFHLTRHHPRRPVIQYSRAVAIESTSLGVLDTPHSRGMTAEDRCAVLRPQIF